MKAPSKIIARVGLGLLSFVATLSVAAPVLADPPATTTPTTTGNDTAVCKQIQNLDSTKQAAIAAKITAMQSDFASRTNGIENRQQTIDAKVSDTRTKTQATFENKIQTLLQQAGLTDTQKTAVKTYQTAVQQAEKTRQDAVDGARTAYRNALMESVGTYQNNLAAATDAFKAAVSTAFTGAETGGCDSGAMATLRLNVRAARTNFASQRVANKVSTDIKSLIQTRNQTIKDADAAFTKAITAYTATLKKALAS